MATHNEMLHSLLGWRIPPGGDDRGLNFSRGGLARHTARHGDPANLGEVDSAKHRDLIVRAGNPPRTTEANPVAAKEMYEKIMRYQGARADCGQAQELLAGATLELRKALANVQKLELKVAALHQYADLCATHASEKKESVKRAQRALP